VTSFQYPLAEAVAWGDGTAGGGAGEPGSSAAPFGPLQARLARAHDLVLPTPQRRTRWGHSLRP
jgi:hypothetical protein